jgi:hypothetical protein
VVSMISMPWLSMFEKSFLMAVTLLYPSARNRRREGI